MEATDATNCVCYFITEAGDWARELESVPEEKRGPLHGLPVSLKECINVKVSTKKVQGEMVLRPFLVSSFSDWIGLFELF